jgi:hypothetical protein
MNEMLRSAKLSKDAESSDVTEVEVQIIVDEKSGKVTLVPPEVRVYKGDIVFQVMSTAFRFARYGIKFNTTSEEGNAVPEGLFTQIEQTAQRIVIHDRYDKDKYVAQDWGRFGYSVKLENADGTPLPDGVDAMGVVVNY